MAKIGFIGLGHMGLPMASHLIKAGHMVTGFDLNPEAIRKLADHGGITSPTLSQVAQEQDVIITMLQTSRQVREVCIGQEGLFYKAAPGTLYIDCSSIDVASEREIHQKAQEHHLISVDAPVSGGVGGAAAATLTFMVGGTKEGFAKAKPILLKMGKKIIHTGEAGSGQAAKICNNMILGISMIAVSEAFVLAEHLGLSAQKLFEVVSNASGQCWAMSHYVPVPDVLPHVPANNQYQPGFTSSMMLKDLQLSQQAAEAAGIKLTMGNLANQLYQQLCEKDMANLDFSAIIKLFQK